MDVPTFVHAAGTAVPRNTLLLHHGSREILARILEVFPRTSSGIRCGGVYMERLSSLASITCLRLASAHPLGKVVVTYTGGCRLDLFTVDRIGFFLTVNSGVSSVEEAAQLENHKRRRSDSKYSLFLEDATLCTTRRCHLC